MQQFTIHVTVLLENSLWVAIFERHDDEGYAVARKIFGDEPTDPELYHFILANYQELNFSEAHDFKIIIKRKNHKRMQRDVKKEVAKAKKGLSTVTHAQEMLRLELEKNKKTRKIISKVEKEIQLERKFLMKQAKKKKKHQGH